MACSSILRHSPDPASATMASFPQTLIEYRKDGAISRMRCHKGNIPVLPQTKLCLHCPARFTRTTHLNRHLRTHTGERQHRCEACDAQFTRSDLLTRHKKTCGDSSHAGRTRRRSCQACADSKVKCDLQQPCSKCQARGKECVFVIRSSRSSASSKVRPSTTESATEHVGDSVAADTVVSSPQSTPPTTLLPASSPSAALPTSLRPNVSSDHLDQMSFPWASTIMPLADQAADGADAQTLNSGGPSPSPSESGSFTSGLTSPAVSGSATIKSPLSSFCANDDLEPFFSILSADNSAYLYYENMHEGTTLVSAATSSPIPSVEDARSYSRDSRFIHDAQQQSEPLFYGQYSNEQVYIPSEHFSHSQHFVQGNYISGYSIPFDVRQQRFSEGQHYRKRLVYPYT
ncbi:hypothetical protein F5I97DRAFT_680258 [Phlebopus sp. FC_14]|nr:hypothetical protein F5I97DRAFT_680258 [Phlebopus sp. FC_14]